MSPAVLEGCGLTKAYGGVTVVDGIHIAVGAGEIRAVIGENGAGKSTLMGLLTGTVRPDAGEIQLNGAQIYLPSPRAAAEVGIAIVHQELQLVPRQSVADNLMLVRPPGARTVRRGTRAERAWVRAVLDRVGLDVALETQAGDLPVAQCQLLEIAKALALDAQVIIFDEPTAALLPVEAGRLLELIEALRKEGKAILYVSHALEEVLRLADRITVLRDGQVVAEPERAQAERDGLIQAMVDRPVGVYDYELAAPGDEVVLSADQVTTGDVRDVTFELRAGEILGFAGLMGCGSQDAALALCGAKQITSGTLTLRGQTHRFRSPYQATRAGVVMVPEERKRDGLIPELSVCENLHIGRYRCHARRGLVNPQRLRAAAADLVRRFKIRLTSIDQPITTLSGGNQQKALLARCVQGLPHVLVVASPTRGVDVGAKEAIHQLILELAAQGTAIIVISPELEELTALAHRIAVFSRGRMVSILPRGQATATRIMQCAVGGPEQKAEVEHAA